MAPVLHSPASVGHVLAVLLALAAGTAVLRQPKGTRRHRQLGRVYVGSTSVGLLTAFRIYALFGRFGIVHWGAVGSAAALLLGTGPKPAPRRPNPRHLRSLPKSAIL